MEYSMIWEIAENCLGKHERSQSVVTAGQKDINLRAPLFMCQSGANMLKWMLP